MYEMTWNCQIQVLNHVNKFPACLNSQAIVPTKLNSSAVTQVSVRSNHSVKKYLKIKQGILLLV